MAKDHDKPTRRRLPWMAIIFVAFLVAYLEGYFALSRFSPGTTTVSGFVIPAYRTLDYHWMATAYEPVRIIESVIRGTTVTFLVDPF